MEQAKPETVEKVSRIVKKQLALPDDSTVNGESKFSTLGADSLDTVKLYCTLLSMFHISFPLHVLILYSISCIGTLNFKIF